MKVITHAVQQNLTRFRGNKSKPLSESIYRPNPISFLLSQLQRLEVYPRFKLQLIIKFLVSNFSLDNIQRVKQTICSGRNVVKYKPIRPKYVLLVRKAYCKQPDNVENDIQRAQDVSVPEKHNNNHIIYLVLGFFGDGFIQNALTK